MTNVFEFINEPDTIRNEAVDNGLLVTDNRTTEPLHKLLDERGLSYQTDYLHTVWHVGPKLYDARNNLDGTYTVDNLTPEQVIAATLGETYSREEMESVFVSGYSLGTLPVGSDPQWDENRQTVDEHMADLGWVRSATLGSGTLTAEQVRKVLLYHLPHREYYSIEQTGAWQAIADELNAELGSGRCENEWESSGGFRCSECLTEIVSTEANYPMPMEFRFCPNCGKMVV